MRKNIIISCICTFCLVVFGFLYHFFYIEPFSAVYTTIIVTSYYIAVIFYGVRRRKALLKWWSLVSIFLITGSLQYVLCTLYTGSLLKTLVGIGLQLFVLTLHQFLHKIDSEVESYVSLRQYYFGNNEKLDELAKSLTKVQRVWYNLIYKR